MQRLGGQRTIDLSGDLTDPCGWGEVPSQGEGARGDRRDLREKMKAGVRSCCPLGPSSGVWRPCRRMMQKRGNSDA